MEKGRDRWIKESCDRKYYQNLQLFLRKYLQIRQNPSKVKTDNPSSVPGSSFRKERGGSVVPGILTPDVTR